jgi:hypothetical protein
MIHPWNVVHKTHQYLKTQDGREKRGFPSSVIRSLGFLIMKAQVVGTSISMLYLQLQSKLGVLDKRVNLKYFMFMFRNEMSTYSS